MKAIIFAAGMSSRLGELTKELPKSCLKINGEITMLERNLLILSKYGFDEVLIITGHAKEAFDQIVNKFKPVFKSINTKFNELFKERNNIYTAYLCKEELDSSSLIINSDLVISQDIIKIAKEAIDSSEESFMVIDDFNQVDEESMKVYVDDSQKITRVNKALDIKDSLGEYIGVLRISDKDKDIFFASIDKILENQEYNLYYEDAIDRASDQMHVLALSTQGSLWTEIDTKEDYKKALELGEKLSKELEKEVSKN